MRKRDTLKIALICLLITVVLIFVGKKIDSRKTDHIVIDTTTVSVSERPPLNQ